MSNLWLLISALALWIAYELRKEAKNKFEYDLDRSKGNERFDAEKQYSIMKREQTKIGKVLILVLVIFLILGFIQRHYSSRNICANIFDSVSVSYDYDEYKKDLRKKYGSYSNCISDWPIFYSSPSLDLPDS